MIEAVDLCKYVTSGDDTVKILQGVSFIAKDGESLAITGKSGSGKSTLLGLLAGLDLPSSGKVLINGQDISQMDEGQRAAVRAAHIGFVFQAFHLLPALTALENVRMPLDLRGDPEADTLARHFLDSVGLSHRADHFPRHLSGGEQQRVAIARAFASRPDILFADEPTGNLDDSTGTLIADLIFDLNQSAGTTLIMVTHDQRLAARCQRELVLRDGKLQNQHQPETGE